jgi:hypothetical protein
MSNIEDKLWEHLVEHHEADRAQLRSATTTRAQRRPVMVGMAATGLAAVGVASVLAISSGSGSPAVTGPRAGGSAFSAPTGPAVTIEDTAYIVKRVKANIADGSQNGLVIDSFSYAGSHLTSDGSLVDLGPKTFDAYYYTAPDGTVYMRNTSDNNKDESTAVLGPIVNAKRPVTQTIFNNADHTYRQTQTTEVYGSAAANARAQPAVNLNSSSSEVQHALRSGQVTQMAMTTVNGTQAIALSVKPRIPGSLTLYVDAQTYQPLRLVSVVAGNSAPPYVSDWLPATPDNIAKAKDDSIPAGYTKVNNHAGNTGSGSASNTGNTGAG